MLKRCRAVFAVLLIWWPLAGFAAGASDHLRQFNLNVTSATGEFTQTTLNENGQAAGGQQQGTFSFERPGKFKWHVSKPYEQLTLSDGRKLYQYDPDLAQVIVRGIDESVGTSPAAILFGSGQLDDSFELSSLPDKGGLNWLRAQPRGADAGFAHVDMGFQNGMPVRLLLLDSFGQTTRIDLSNMVTNPSLAADEFEFTPPQDVDIVTM